MELQAQLSSLSSKLITSVEYAAYNLERVCHLHIHSYYTAWYSYDQMLRLHNILWTINYY